jgi:hypothetical protein
MVDYLSPQLVADTESMRKVEQSTISLTSLVEGRVRPDQIERAFSSQGCGAVLIKLDAHCGAMYDRFYRLQWQLCTRVLDNNSKYKETAVASFAALDMPVRQLVLRCGVGVARIRKGLMSPVPLPQPDVDTFLLSTPLSAALGRPLAANRQEFHPSVDWLIEQEEKGCLRRDETPSYAVVADFSDHWGLRVMGRAQADEARLLALYREWKYSNREERCSHGNKYNGDVYYGAFRGHTHIDSGGTMTVLFGAGDLRDRDGFAVDGTIKSGELGGTLMVASPGEEKFVSLPYRLPCGSPYVVVFFENFDKPSPPTPPTSIVEESDGSGSGNQKAAVARQLRRQAAINTNALGWAATVHGVRRIENEGFSRGQAVVHVLMTEDDLA